MSTKTACQCGVCIRALKWNNTSNKKVLFYEMCNVVINSEFEEQSAKHELQMMREYITEINEYDNYIKWRQS